MVDEKRVAVVVTAYNEEHLIGQTLAGIPGFVDRVFVVDDSSTDGTAARVAQAGAGRVRLLKRERNGGVGAAIVTGYGQALAEDMDVVCVMAGDNQMDLADLLALVEPVARGEVDHAKANRLVTGTPATATARGRRLRTG